MLIDAGADVGREDDEGGTSAKRECATTARMFRLFRLFAEERAEVRRVAFAMGHHARIGGGSLVLGLEEGVVRMILEQV